MNNQTNYETKTNMMLTPEHRRSPRRVSAPKKNLNQNRYAALSNYRPRKLYYHDEGKYDGDERAGVYSIYHKPQQDSDDEN